ncbi:hypothetical protein WMO40_23115 [Bacillaceae bacterium CLA-AA-H227]|uniref:Uncharacterized protein n=1 Tax=Robertmurraya yapensis (ex Hitch et al 2024) TaxID=3133160 RepID=A0ACC6SI94_9BACI
MIFRFANNDIDYEKWCKENRNGFVFNYFGGTDNRADMNKVHKVDCPYLWRNADEGKRTTKYEKVCSSNFDQLVGFVNAERGESLTYCKNKRCFGT